MKHIHLTIRNTFIVLIITLGVSSTANACWFGCHKPHHYWQKPKPYIKPQPKPYVVPLPYVQPIVHHNHHNHHNKKDGHLKRVENGNAYE